MSHFVTIVLSLLLHSMQCDASSNHILVENTIVQCSNEDVLTIGSAKQLQLIRLASSFHGHVQFDLKLYSRCKKKLFITLKVTDTPEDFISNAIVILTHGKNSLTKKTSRFGNPIAVKFVQGKIFHKYPLKYLYRVNGNMSEEILNSEHNKKTYDGCNNQQDATNPTCGFFPTIERHPAGFCCSCGDQKGGIHPRGQFNCNALGKTPGQLTSAHCLRPCPYHYNVYELKHPILYQRLRFEVFRSEPTKNGNMTWHRMSTTNGVQVDNDNTVGTSGAMKVTYFPHLPAANRLPEVFDPASQRLLAPIPSETSVDRRDLPDPFRGPPPDQMLVVSNTLLSPDGAECDKIGSALKAFTHQENPCNKPPNSCLKNQPFDLWKRDQGKNAPTSAKFRLSSFQSPESNIPPFADFSRDRTEGYLYTEEKAPAPTTVHIEVPADDISIISPGYNAFIKSGLTSTREGGAEVVVNITNNEQADASFTVQLVECSVDILGVEGGTLTSEMENIGPLETKNFTLDIKSSDITQTVFCFVLLVNQFGDSIAAREITFEPNMTCSCADTCQCACGNVTHVKCVRLTDDNILAAGLYHEIKSAFQIQQDEEHESQQRMKRIFHWVLIIHIIIFIIGGIAWSIQKCIESCQNEEDENQDGIEVGSSDSEGVDDETETDYACGQPISARSTEGSEVTLYKKKSEKKKHKEKTSDPSIKTPDEPSIVTLSPIADMSKTSASHMAVQAGSDLMGIDHNSPANLSHVVSFKADNEIPKKDVYDRAISGLKSKASVKPSTSTTDVTGRTKSLPAVHGEGANDGSKHTTNTSIHHQPSEMVDIHADYSQVEHKVPSHIVPPAPSRSISHKTKKSKGKGGQAFLHDESPSIDLGFGSNSNTDSQTENNVDAYLAFCATASSSQTSFGTYNRRRRDQYSAYDFLPEPRHRASVVTWDS